MPPRQLPNAMIERIRKLFSRQEPELPPARIPAGQRVYAIGDIHGRLDLFDQAILAIEEDDARRGPADTTVILLGDLIDRGPDSAMVVKTARQWQQRRNVRALLGNHEQMLLDAMTDKDTLRHLLRYGGRETLLSYGMSPAEYETSLLDDILEGMPRMIPADDVAWMRSMEDRIAIGDYLFVHAGIRPGIPLEEQRTSDLRWIRGEFLDDPRDHGCVVVHGHSITPEVAERRNRIGIDTGAYNSGVLTTLALEGEERWYLTASAIDTVAE